MLKYLLKIVLISAILTTSLAIQAENSELHPKEEYANIATVLAKKLPIVHLNHHALDNEIAGKALDHFLRTLDKNKLFFLADEVTIFRKNQDDLDDQLLAGDLTVAYEIFKKYRERIQEHSVFVKKFLTIEIALDSNQEIAINREKAPWLKDEDSQHNLWRKSTINKIIKNILTSKDKESAQKVLLQKAKNEVLKNNIKQLNTIMSLDEEWVLQQYLNSFAYAYDPHCSYMAPIFKEYFDTRMHLSFVGIGVRLSLEDGYTKVNELIAGGPAESAGDLKVGDRIFAIGQGDDEPVDIMHWPRYKSSKLIRGKKGTKVILMVIPASDTTGTIHKKIIITRDKVNLKDSSSKGELKIVPLGNDQNIKLGVITIPSFYRDSAKKRNSKDFKSCTRDVVKIINDLKKKDATGFIIDLRNNGGGSLQEALEMTGLFIKTGPVVQVKDNRFTRILTDNNPYLATDKPLIVIINKLSASASEILAGALQDYGRAIIVGDHQSFGKGTVQGIMPMDYRDKTLGSIKITTALFYRITGLSTQIKGVAADINLASPYNHLDIGESHLPNALKWTKERTARFNKITDLTATIAKLKANSAKRCKENMAYQSYLGTIKTIKKFNDKKIISLNITKRREFAKIRKNIKKLNDDLATKKGQKKDDHLLVESLNILADFVKISNDNKHSQKVLLKVDHDK